MLQISPCLIVLRCAGLQAPMLRRRTARARLQLALEERQAVATAMPDPSAASMLLVVWQTHHFVSSV